MTEDNHDSHVALKAECSSRLVTFVSGLPLPYPALESTSLVLHNLDVPQYNLVEVGQYGSSRLPLASFGFKFCDAVIIRPKDMQPIRGLAHITSGSNPDEYIKSLRRLMKIQSLEALIIKSGVENNRLNEALRDAHIAIHDVIDIPKRDTVRSFSKDLIVLPDKSKMILNVEQLGLQEIPF